MMHPERWARVFIAVLAVSSLVVVSGCTSTAEKEISASEQIDGDYLLPLLRQKPLPVWDVRNLSNCAERDFEDVRRGPWDQNHNKELSLRASPRHRTSDRVVTVGQSISLGAKMQYDEGPLSREWVRLFVGSCDGWTQVGTRKTDEEGTVAFRLDKRLSAGVYDVVFQSAGDATKVRSQLWVLAREADVVVFDLRRAVFEFSDEDWTRGTLEPVVAAATLAGWHIRRGRVVVYVDAGNADSGEVVDFDALETWRKRLREAGFGVGPVVDLGISLSIGVEEGVGSGGWGTAGEKTAVGPKITTPVSILYTADPEAAAALKSTIDVEEFVYRREYCQSEEQRCDQAGWKSRINELEADEEGDDPG